MPRETLIAFILWTMKHYGSDAGERETPGSKLIAQAKHIADFVQQYEEAYTRINDLPLVTITTKYKLD